MKINTVQYHCQICGTTALVSGPAANKNKLCDDCCSMIYVYKTTYKPAVFN